MVDTPFCGGYNYGAIARLPDEWTSFRHRLIPDARVGFRDPQVDALILPQLKCILSKQAPGQIELFGTRIIARTLPSQRVKDIPFDADGEIERRQAGKVPVAILDSGVHSQYKPFGDGRSISFVDDYPWVDSGNHGSKVAKLLVDDSCASSFYGRAPEAIIVPIKVFFGGSGVLRASQVLCGIEWAVQNGIKLINASLEFSRKRSEPPSGLSRVIGGLLRRRQDVLLIASSGNHTNLSDDAPVSEPAAAPSACAVGGVHFGGMVVTHDLTCNRGDRYSSVSFSGPSSQICGFSGSSQACAYVTACCVQIISGYLDQGKTPLRNQVLRDLRKFCYRPVSPWERSRGGAGIPML